MGLQEMKSEKVQSERAGEEAEGEEAKQLKAGQEISQGQWCFRNLRLGNAIGVSDAFYGFVLVHSLQSPSQDLFHHFPRSASRLKHSYMTKMQHVSGVLTTLFAPSQMQLLPLLQFSAAGQGAWGFSLSGAFSLHVHLSQVCLGF